MFSITVCLIDIWDIWPGWMGFPWGNHEKDGV